MLESQQAWRNGQHGPKHERVFQRDLTNKTLYLWSMTIPNTLACVSCFAFQLLLPSIFFGRLSFQFLQFRPSIFEDFRREINACNLAISEIPEYVIVRRE